MKKFRKLAAAFCAAFVLLISFSTVAYAGGGEETEETTETVTESAVDETNPLTPDGTGTVLDSATSADNKQFYTVTTPAGNIFYLIIDLDRDSDNVYFLDAVTEKDLLALAEQSEDTEVDDSTSAIPDTSTGTAAETTPEPEAESEGDTDTEAEVETNSGGGISIVLVVLIVLAAGGAGYYFKIYRPKQQQADMEDEYEAGDDYGDYEDNEADTYGEDAEPEDGDDGPPWYEDEEEQAGDAGEDEE